MTRGQIFVKVLTPKLPNTLRKLLIRWGQVKVLTLWEKPLSEGTGLCKSTNTLRKKHLSDRQIFVKVLTPELPGSMSRLRQIFVKVLMFGKETPYQKKFCSTHSLPPKAINQSVNSLTEKGLTQHKLNNLCACANLLCISHSSTYHAIQNHSWWKTVGLNQLSLSRHINIPCDTESNHSGWKTVGLNQLSLSRHINIPCDTESNHSGWKTVGLNQLSLSCHINIPCDTESNHSGWN